MREVKLRGGVAWHEGEPFTAEDIAFGYRFLSRGWRQRPPLSACRGARPRPIASGQPVGILLRRQPAGQRVDHICQSLW